MTPTLAPGDRVTVRAISYGGGVQSTALLVLAARKEIDYPLALFANVGDDSEHPATLRYVREVAMPYAAEHGIELVELRKRPRGRERSLYADLMRPESRSIGIPVRLEGSGAPSRRQCTTQYKILRIAGEIKARGATGDDPAVCAMGISRDEFGRMRSDSGFPYQRLAYPLIDRRMDRADCVAMIEREGLPVPPKSSCFFCPFHTLAQFKQLARKEPDLFEKACALEETLSERSERLGRGKVYMTNAQRPLREVTSDDGQLDMFEDGAGCDIGGYCHA